MDTFREVSPEEAKMLTLQFMGQHLTGDLKQLDQHIIQKNPTLQGVTFDPNKILNSVPVQQPPANVVNAGLNIEQSLQPINIQTVSTPVPQVQPTPRDPNQLEFDFDNCSYSKTIFERLDSMDRKLSQLLELFKKTENLD
jgi:hypothetical protein